MQRPGRHMPSPKKPNLLAKMIEETGRTEKTVAPRCRHFGTCGGCDLQHLPYPAQLRLKRRLVEAAMAALPQTQPCEVRDVLPATDEWRYRNKVEMTFDQREDGALALGYSPKTKWWQRIDVEECWLCPERMLGAAFAVKAWAAQAGLVPYHQRRHEGFLRHLVMRESPVTGDFLINLVTAEGPLPDSPLVDAVREFRPRGVLRSIHSGPAAAVKFERVEALAGEPSIRERVGGLSFMLSPESFFQTNTAMSSRLLEVISQAAELRGGERVLDVFCGVGTIGLTLAHGRDREVVKSRSSHTSPFQGEDQGEGDRSRRRTLTRLAFGEGGAASPLRQAQGRLCEGEEFAGRPDPGDSVTPGRARAIVGVESVEAAVESARRNAAVNGIDNARFVCATAREYLREHRGEAFDVVILDPPRPGCGPRVIRRLLEMRPPRIVYVSCNPQALAADLALLSGAYEVGPIQPVDMFPQTGHVEAVVALTAR